MDCFPQDLLNVSGDFHTFGDFRTFGSFTERVVIFEVSGTVYDA